MDFLCWVFFCHFLQQDCSSCNKVSSAKGVDTNGIKGQNDTKKAPWKTFFTSKKCFFKYANHRLHIMVCVSVMVTRSLRIHLFCKYRFNSSGKGSILPLKQTNKRIHSDSSLNVYMVLKNSLECDNCGRSPQTAYCLRLFIGILHICLWKSKVNGGWNEKGKTPTAMYLLMPFGLWCFNSK